MPFHRRVKAHSATASALASWENERLRLLYVGWTRARDRLILANVSAIWCSSCRTFDSDVLADEAVRELIENQFVFVRLEYESDEGKEFRERYEVKGFPRLVVLDAEGVLLMRLPTVFDPVVFRASLAGAS